MKKYKVPSNEIHFSFSRSSGKGGQNVNKVNTRATLHWDVAENRSLPQGLIERFTMKFESRINSMGVCKISSEKYRHQERNCDDCLLKLQQMIDSVATPPKKRRKTKVPRKAKEKRLQGKRKQSEKKQLRQKNY